MWVCAGPIRLARRRFEMLAETFGMGQTQAQDLIEGFGKWLETQNPSLRANWWAALIARMQKVTGYHENTANAG